MKRTIILFSIMILPAIVSTCTPDPPSLGFRIHTTLTHFVVGSPVPVTDAATGVGLIGNFESVINNATPTSGSVAGFSGFTNGDANLDINSAKLPANWHLGETNGFCAGKGGTVAILGKGLTIPLDCRQVPFTFFSYSPGTIQRDSPPASITIEGTDISSAGGMPTVEYYDLNGTLVAQDTATDVAFDGSALTAPAPNVSLFASGAYIAVVRNVDGNSPGNGVVVIFDYIEPPPDPPPDPDSCGSGGECLVY